MASKVLPQALLVHPANHSIQCPPLKKQQQQLGFSFESSRRFSLSNSRSNSLSRASLNLTGLNLKPILRNSFVVRAEAEAGENAEVEAESAAVEESSENVEAAEEVSLAETETRPPRQPRVKLGDIMGILNKRAIEASEAVLPLPSIRTGDIVQLKLDNPAIRRRLSVYKGIVISRQNAGIHTTIRIRRIMSGVGVEIVFPLYSPMIKEVKVLSHRKVRKARLYYLRDKLPRFSTFK